MIELTKPLVMRIVRESYSLPKVCNAVGVVEAAGSSPVTQILQAVDYLKCERSPAFPGFFAVDITYGSPTPRRLRRLVGEILIKNVKSVTENIAPVRVLSFFFFFFQTF
jgi:hypothetical protein